MLGAFSLLSTGKIATGGTITYDGNYQIHTFSAGVSTFTVYIEKEMAVLVVGGGGSGTGTPWGGGGGGAGGVIYDADRLITVGSYDVTVGTGGAAPAVGENGNAGGDSVFHGLTGSGAAPPCSPTPDVTAVQAAAAGIKVRLSAQAHRRRQVTTAARATETAAAV